MKKLFVVGVVFISSCAPKPQIYAESLALTDPKYNSPDCKEIRLKALGYDDKVGQRAAIGLASGLLLGPFGIPIAVAVDSSQNEERRVFAREVHLRCSSQPLPENLKSETEKQS